jgi:hypothetical protein
MQYDGACDRYTGTWVTVPGALFEQVLAARTYAGERADAVLEDLLDELSWSLDIPGVRPTDYALVSHADDRTPWPLRFRVGVVHSEPRQAEELQYELEQAGMRAPTFVVVSAHDHQALPAFLTPAPTVCIIDSTALHGACGSTTRGALRSRAHLLETTAADVPASVAHRVRRLLLTRGARVSADTHMAKRAAVLLRARLLRQVIQEQSTHTLAYRGWTLSLLRRNRRAVARAVMLREQAQALRIQHAATLGRQAWPARM